MMFPIFTIQYLLIFRQVQLSQLSVLVPRAGAIYSYCFRQH